VITINAAKGLGDAIQLRAIVLHLVRRGDTVMVFTRWRELFEDLPVIVKPLSDVTGDEDWHHAKPCLHCRMPWAQNLDQFTMSALQSGIEEPVELRVDWKPKNLKLRRRVIDAANGRKVMVYQPLKKTKNENQELLRPNADAYDGFIARTEFNDYFRVRIGSPATVDPSAAPYDLDLLGKTSVTDVFDVASVTDLFFSETSYLPLLAQAMDKPVVCMFARKGIASGRNLVGNIRPERMFHKHHLTTAVYDE